jgi:hypothetical protein
MLPNPTLALSVPALLSDNHHDPIGVEQALRYAVFC